MPGEAPSLPTQPRIGAVQYGDIDDALSIFEQVEI